MPVAPMPRSAVSGVSDATDPTEARRLLVHTAPREVVAKAREAAFGSHVGKASDWKTLKRFMQRTDDDQHAWRNDFRRDPLHAELFRRAMDLSSTDEAASLVLRTQLLQLYAAASAANVPGSAIADRVAAHVAKAEAHEARLAEIQETARAAREAKAMAAKAAKALFAAATEAKAKAKPKASHTPPPPTGEGRSRRPRNR